MLKGVLHKGWQVVLVSGNTNNSATSSVFIVNANNSSSNANSNVGTHVCLLLKIIACNILASWQNTKQSPIRFGTHLWGRIGGEISK